MRTYQNIADFLREFEFSDPLYLHDDGEDGEDRDECDFKVIGKSQLFIDKQAI